MKRVVTLILIGFITGCVTPPQTVEEFREGVRRGATFTKIEEEEINRPFAETFEAVKKNADRCMNVTVRSSTPNKYGPMMQSIRYRSHSKMTGKKTAEMVLQQDARATGKMPDGGYLVMLADIARSSNNKTRVTVYGASVGYNNVFKSIFAWGRGEKHDCPKFPMGGSGQQFTYHSK